MAFGETGSGKTKSARNLEQLQQGLAWLRPLQPRNGPDIPDAVPDSQQFRVGQRNRRDDSGDGVGVR